MALRAFFNSVISGTAPFRTYVLVGFSVMALTAVMLFAMGREPICECGEVWLWSGDIVSSNNSQHLLDPYSFTHVEHGFGFYALLKFAAGGMPLPLRALFAIALESGWEVLENTDLVINKYREDTISLGYFGDSIVNSLSDILMNVIGFVLAARLRARSTVFIFLAIESFLLFWIRDNLILNIVMLIYPLSAIKAWQLGG
ncbi:MAG TPA: DUF2585 family protein [Vicinamibacteria bacterium]|nr:DUF2585 family protein [Vicinamibacteria bacterium]